MSGPKEFAGTLDERVTVWAPPAARDALGAATGDWAVRTVAWAGVRIDGRGALNVGDAASGLTVWRVTLRPCGVAVGDRIERASGTIEVHEVRADPTLPDRVVAIGEERR